MRKLISDNKIFSGNVLKIIALVCMTLDHVGEMFFPSAVWMRIIGRLAFPIFAFMISEGCRYTKNKARYLGTMASMALIMQIVYFVFEKSLYMCIFVTFSLSVTFIYVCDNFLNKKTFTALVFVLAAFCGIFYLTKILPQTSSFWIDYGFFGVMLPVAVYYSKGFWEKIITFSLVLLLISLDLRGVQLYSLFAVILIMLYNGKRGRMNLKYLFYVYYPLHLAVIYLIYLIL